MPGGVGGKAREGLPIPIVEVWTARGLVTCYVLFVMRLKTRSVHIAGATTAPSGAYMKQVART